MEKPPALSRLLSYIFNSTQAQIDIVSTNYDRIGEYAAELANFSYYKGFGSGYINKTLFTTNRHESSKKQRGTINIWKVQGCLDWFQNSENKIIGITLANKIPENHFPCIVTPGDSKYIRAHFEPFRDIITEADKALDSANGFLCIGFGFNDNHIQPKLEQRLKQRIPIVVIAKNISEKTIDRISSIEGCRYILLDETTIGTRVNSHLFSGVKKISKAGLWDLSNFIEVMT